MNKIIILSLVWTIGCIPCKKSKKRVDKLEIAKQYYRALDSSDDSGIVTVLSDSIVIRESEYDYEEKFSKKGYVEWLKWDALFGPTYKILQIKQKGDVVKAKISKIDKRILFLHEEPIVSNEVIRFENNKISRVEKTYSIFNEAIWERKKNKFLDWIHKNHSELPEFLNDQTKKGGLHYLKALELYKDAN